ncbi:sulfur reduction protein DsrE [Hydrogenovibrio crunogenus]|uniref:Sulfur reduction protein DsrE n=1 Tax=Hydrogenovibrio crunogenus TaxID=39765 RepID=A0A4V1C8L4_9GAMM|nr:DsrE family protein [Hydrogenovibrio crunogenus]QBZ82314.1 sulfur reduction protein DsrE [Hydrogenovibrio crunogenus]
MLKYLILASGLISFFIPTISSADSRATNPIPFVVELTRNSENFGHRRALLQINEVINEIGEDKLAITVVAYENGIHALLADNPKTSQLLTKLSNRGVTFKACKISMKSWGLSEEQFPLEVEYVPAGAPEMIRLQMKGYKYWKQ